MKRFYVYTLSYPGKNGKVFYVGKGSGDRPEEHIIEARRGDCHCRKCKAIRRIIQSGRQVKIDRVFETDSAREALQKESELIRELSKQLHLCNKSGNIYYKNGPPPPKPLVDMTFDELCSYLKCLDVDKKEIQRIRDDWRNFRLGWLTRQWAKLRRMRRNEEAERVNQEIDEIVSMFGEAWQHQLNL